MNTPHVRAPFEVQHPADYRSRTVIDSREAYEVAREHLAQAEQADFEPMQRYGWAVRALGAAAVYHEMWGLREHPCRCAGCQMADRAAMIARFMVTLLPPEVRAVFESWMTDLPPVRREAR